MSEILKFPNGEKSNNENTVENEIAKQNANYFNNIKAKMQIEYDALKRTGNAQAIQLGEAINLILRNITDIISDVFTKNSELNSNVQAPYFLNQCMQSVNAIFAGGVISPITGDEEEWVDTTVEDDIGQEFKVNYRGKEYTIPIQSVQVNKRYPKIYRLNNDNNLAHRIDYFQFHDAKNPEHVHLTEDSIRFIQFPYVMKALHSHCIVEDRVISDYLDFDYAEIKDGLIYPDQSNDDQNSYVIAPKIPFSMLEEAGVIIESEIEEYLNAISNSESMNSFDGEQDDWEND